MPTTILTLSGGLDSAVLLYHLLDLAHGVKALSFNYAQRHSKELDHARALCAKLGIEHRVVDLSSLAPLFSNSGLVNRDVAIPRDDYADVNMRVTVVPNRNMIMLSIAAAWAINVKAGRVAFAAHAGHHTLYPDCAPPFIHALDRAIRLADWHPVQLLAPFADMTKAQIVARGAELRVPFQRTWSCYEGGEIHCGTCATCRERRQAFGQAGVSDPTPYAACIPGII